MATLPHLVTIVIPAYNHEKFVKTCLDSAAAQTYSNLELLIINDGSTDSTHEVIQDWLKNPEAKFKRIEYISQTNKGLTATLNSALNWARGKYISPIASDDIMCPDKISLLVESLEQKGDGFAAAFGNAQFIDEIGDFVNLEIKDRDGYVLSSQHLFLDYYTYGRNLDFYNPKVFGSYSSLLTGNYLPAMSCLIRTDFIRNVGGWTAGNSVEDWELWLKLAKNHSFAFINQIVALYRLHGNNATKVKREQILRDSLWLLENEKTYALKENLHRYFYSVYQFNLRMLKEFDPKLTRKKRFHLFRDKEFYQYFLKRFKNKFNG